MAHSLQKVPAAPVAASAAGRSAVRLWLRKPERLQLVLQINLMDKFYAWAEPEIVVRPDQISDQKISTAENMERFQRCFEMALPEYSDLRNNAKWRDPDS